MPETLTLARMDTPLGPMVAAASTTALRLLEFDRPGLEPHGGWGRSHVLDRTEREIEEYFAGRRRAFTVPLELGGTPFQRQAWESLLRIPYGETRSYGEQAAAMGRPRAVRAVGRANGANRIALIVPCHRVIGADGSLTGYGAGVWRKERLLVLEGVLETAGS
jgi:AraC family transcriptional regulator, regulatory protein of adaptative response / methylated-DNA-[protein]-cysteine methyltransferase